MGTLAAENLDVCIACDLWDSNIQLTMGIDQRQQIYPNIVQLVSYLFSRYQSVENYFFVFVCW